MNISRAISGVQAAQTVLKASRIPKEPELSELKSRLGEAESILTWCRDNRDVIKRAMGEERVNADPT